MELVAAPGLVLTAYTAEPAGPSAGSLNLLATWAATETAHLSRPAKPSTERLDMDSLSEKGTDEST